MSTSPKRTASGSLVNTSIVGSNLHIGGGGGGGSGDEEAPPKKEVKRGRKAKKTTLRNGTLVENSVIDGIPYKCAISIGGYLVDMADSDVDPESVMESAIETGHARSCAAGAAAADAPDVLGLPNGSRVQDSEICGKACKDAIVVDGRLVEIAELPDEESRAAATAEPVCIRASAIHAGNFFHGTWNRGRLIDHTSVFGKGNRIHASMTACYVAGDKNVFAFSNVEVTVLGSSNEIHTPLRSCRIRGSRNVLNAGFVKSHIRGNHNTFEKGLENSYVTGDKNKFRGKVVNCNITGDKNKFGGDLVGCTMESSETEIGYQE